MKRLTASLIALGIACGTQAQDLHAQEMDRSRDLVTSVTTTEMRYIIESADFTVQDDLSTGIGFVGQDANDLVFGVQGKACDDAQINCSGLEFFLVLEGRFSAADANQINQRWSAIKATALDNGEMMLSRYVIIDHGQTLENLRLNLMTTRAIAMQVREETDGAAPEEPATSAAEQVAASALDWGDDSGEYAKDAACDDARFEPDGDDWSYQRNHVLRDATDCRALYEQGEITLYLDFGDNSGEYADDETCDDSRFTGEGRSILETDSHIKRDAADCIAAYRAGTIDRS
ncbi:MAG: YbjN domain-containing protein [Pseudomonadota bacterium]